MKKLIYTILLIFIVCGCSIDNFDAPNAVLTGKIVDSVTNELIENGGGNGGTLIHVFEGVSKQPIICNSYPDGHFTNAAFFCGEYKIVAIGAFRMVSDTLRVTVSNKTDVEIKVVPNIRLKASIVDKNATSIKVKVDYEKMHTTEEIVEMSVIWSTYPYPNMFTFAEGGQKVEKVESENLSSGEKNFEISGLNQGKSYYIRVAARTNAPGGYYNYSKTINY